MLIGERLKNLRGQKHMTQGDIEKRTGLLRCYISRVENGATVPSVSTLEKLAKALDIPLYRLFHDGKPRMLKLSEVNAKEWGSAGKDSHMLGQFRRILRKVRERDQKLLLIMAQKLYQKSERAGRKSQTHDSATTQAL
jgi:transcriptional regulator with XRE-family HTH domain